MIKVVMTHAEVTEACEGWLEAHGMMVGNGAAGTVRLIVVPHDNNVDVRPDVINAVVDTEAGNFNGPYR